MGRELGGSKHEEQVHAARPSSLNQNPSSCVCPRRPPYKGATTRPALPKLPPPRSLRCHRTNPLRPPSSLPTPPHECPQPEAVTHPPPAHHTPTDHVKVDADAAVVDRPVIHVVRLHHRGHVHLAHVVLVVHLRAQLPELPLFDARWQLLVGPLLVLCAQGLELLVRRHRGVHRGPQRRRRGAVRRALAVLRRGEPKDQACEQEGLHLEKGAAARCTGGDGDECARTRVRRRWCKE